MRVSGRFFFIIIIYCSASSCGSTEHIGRHILSLFGFRISQRSAIRVRPFIYSPVIIIPTLNQKHNVNIQESKAEHSYQANGDVFKKLTTGDTNLMNNENVNDTDRVALNDSKQKEYTDNYIDPREVANLRLNNNITDEASDPNTTEQITTTAITSDDNATEQIMKPQMEKINNTLGPYSAPKYNNEFINNLKLTTSAPAVQIKFALPENNDSWKMFATNMKGSFKMYNNKGLSDENTWSRLTSNNYFPGQFIPISGLYHDGYLHRPLLNKEGFVPSRQLYEYNNYASNK